MFGRGEEINKESSLFFILTWVTMVFTVCVRSCMCICACLCVCVVCTNWSASEGCMVTVLLPGAVEA